MDVFSEMIWKRAIAVAKAAKEELPDDALNARYGAQYVIVALTEVLMSEDLPKVERPDTTASMIM